MFNIHLNTKDELNIDALSILNIRLIFNLDLSLILTSYVIIDVATTKYFLILELIIVSTDIIIDIDIVVVIVTVKVR